MTAAPAPTFEQVCDWGNLTWAYRRAARGKRGRPDVATFEYRLEDNLISLREDLVAGSYRPGSYRTFVIHEAKRRVISAAPFRDGVVHHALCRIIEPVFERSLVRDTFANRTGFGTHRALDRAQQLAGRHQYVLQCDLKQFFPSVDHGLLMNALAVKIADTRLLDLAAAILASGSSVLAGEYDMVYFPGDDLFAVERPRGLPIGDLTSQFWANVYLNGFDHIVKRELRCPGYVRYVDDLLLFGDDLRLLRSWKDALVRRLERLRVTLHPGAHLRPVTEGFPFLGFIVFPDRRRIKRRKAIHAQRRLARRAAAYHAGRLPLAAVAASVRGWVNHARYGNTVGLRKAMLSQIVLRPPRRAGRRSRGSEVRA